MSEGHARDEIVTALIEPSGITHAEVALFVDKNLIKTLTSKIMCEYLEDKPPESAYWDREALVHLQNDLRRSRSEFVHLIDEEAAHPAFDPIKVRSLIRSAHSADHHPTGIVLGKMEFASFRHFVSRGFGEECGSPERVHFFMGLDVYEDAAPTRLELIEEDEGLAA